MSSALGFGYSEMNGLLYEGHGRTPVDTLRTWLFPKCKNSTPLSRPKAWWRAQLVLYGIEKPKESYTIAVLRSKLEAGLKDGKCDNVPQEVLKKEEMLKAEAQKKASAFRREMFLKRGGNEDEVEALDNPSSFLHTKFNGENEGKQVVILRKFDDGERANIHAAAQTLGLVSISVDAPDGCRWLIVGKARSEVMKNYFRIERETREVEEEERAAKRRKLEERHAEMMEMNHGKLDFAGIWSIKCDYIDSEWPGDDDLEITIARKHSNSKRLVGNFSLRVVEGVMKFKGEPPSEAGKKMKFKWRGRECGTGQILYDDSEQDGWIALNSDGTLDGVFNFLGTWKLSGLKCFPVNARDIKHGWELYDYNAYERARVSRWH